VPVPTLAGALLLLAIAALAAVGFARAAVPLLAPVEPIGAGLLVVEGWAGSEGFDEAARRFAAGGYASIVTTGGPIEPDSPFALDHTWAEFAARWLARRGLDPASIHAVPAPQSAQERTFLSAVMVREWLAAQPDAPRTLDVVTLGPHGRRSWLLYRRAFGDAARVGIVSVPPEDWDPAHWWRTSEGARAVITETAGLAWTACCFDPGPRGSVSEKWADPR
jgi:hypothetical protein